MTNQNRVALYARVSTDKQECENQLVQLREHCAKQGWAVVAEFVDYESGAKGDREQFQAMFKAASQRKFDVLLFWALDRLTREGVLETLQYLNRLESCGVAYKSYTEQFFDSCGIFKDAILSIMATLAKQERIKRSERTKAGLAIAKARGVRLGQKPVDVSPQAARDLRASGLSVRKIAAQLGVSVGTAHKLSQSQRAA
jgi:DNA invertase Pin-like site-specific DNA recombinase